MAHFFKAFYIIYFMNLVLVFGQNIALEQECNILNTLEVLKAEIELLKKQEKGTTYIRWGRTECPGNGSELVYSGYAGGAFYTNTGGAAEYLCLPRDPEYAFFDDKVQACGLVYGAEYEFSSRLNRMEFFPNIDRSIDLLQNNVPCAVCITKRSTVLMVPARQTCHDGWTREYKGYLTSDHVIHTASSQYICLDDGPEILPGGTANENGKLLYFVEGRCGSLPCPPYVNGRELTCVVCSK